MRRSGWWWFAVLGMAVGGPAVAQVVWDMPGVIIQKPKLDQMPAVQARAETWPRLDPGTTICRTEADLLRLAAARRGEPWGPATCQMIRTPTPIGILRRAGPGRTQVSLTEQNGMEGWTDAWLPEKAPPIGGKGTAIR